MFANIRLFLDLLRQQQRKKDSFLLSDLLGVFFIVKKERRTYVCPLFKLSVYLHNFTVYMHLPWYKLKYVYMAIRITHSGILNRQPVKNDGQGGMDDNEEKR